MDAKRNFLEVALTSGMECQIISPDDVLRHIEPDVLASHLPDEAKTRLLSASLKEGKMDAGLVFETLSPRVFAEHMPENMLWNCIAEAAARVLKDDSISTSVASSISSSLLGDSKSARTAAAVRRPGGPPRRPSRLGQPTRSKTTKTGVEFDLDGELAGSSWPKQDNLTDEVFGDWVEETMTGADDQNRRKR
jgi:hypothetical protein